MEENSGLQPFSSDWTLTKDGKRALVYPIMVIENGEVVPNRCYSQEQFHRYCFVSNFKENVFI
jgi:hypothetical protein